MGRGRKRNELKEARKGRIREVKFFGAFRARWCVLRDVARPLDGEVPVALAAGNIGPRRKVRRLPTRWGGAGRGLRPASSL